MRSEAQDALLTELGRVGNPSSQHRAGQRARRRLEEAREELAAALGAHPGEVIFTSGGSEADSIAILGSLAARPERPRSLISAVEHPAVQEARGRGAEVLAVNSRGVVEDTTWEAADEKVAVISVVRVNNETGVIHPLDGLIATSSRTGAWSHSDAVQAIIAATTLDDGWHYAGMDTSAAPSKNCTSMAEIYRLLRVPHFGASGSIAASALLTRVFKTLNNVRAIGFSGLMLAVTEDQGLADASRDNTFDLRALLTYSSVCGIGLDTVPIPGDTPAATLAAMIADEAAIGVMNHKTTAVRVIPAVGLGVAQGTGEILRRAGR